MDNFAFKVTLMKMVLLLQAKVQKQLIMVGVKKLNLRRNK